MQPSTWAVLAFDAPVIEAINAVVEKRPRRGFWKCFDRLRSDGHGWNHKKVHRGRPSCTLNVIDEANREALRIECGTSIPSSRVVRVMDQLVEVYGKPEALRLHNGLELTADAFVDWAEDNDVKPLFVQPGKPNQNAFVERFNRSFREEVLDTGELTRARRKITTELSFPRGRGIAGQAFPAA